MNKYFLFALSGLVTVVSCTKETENQEYPALLQAEKEESVVGERYYFPSVAVLEEKMQALAQNNKLLEQTAEKLQREGFKSIAPIGEEEMKRIEENGVLGIF